MSIMQMFFAGGAARLPYSVSYLVVGGGGGGGGGFENFGGGGGGAGGFLTGSSFSLEPNTQYLVTVGAGGNYSNGSDSTFSIITATGGGVGGLPDYQPAGSGGSGGGASSFNIAGSGVSGQGYSGGNGYNDGFVLLGGGGGGASQAGGNATSSNGGNGGNGTASSITGTSTYYAGGGGGGSGYESYPGFDGLGGGDSSYGGGGSGGFDSSGDVGGSGIVILSIPTISYSGITTGDPVVSTVGSNTVLTFLSSGSYTA